MTKSRTYWRLAILVGVLLLAGTAAAFLADAPKLDLGSGPDPAARANGPGSPENDEPSGSVPEGFPIHVAGREVYRVRASLGPFSPEERARAAMVRIRNILRAPQFDPSKIRATEVNGQNQIVYGDGIVFSVLPEDVAGEEVPAGIAAARIARELGAAIELDRASRSPKRLAVATALALLVLSAVAGLGRAAIVLARRAQARIIGWKGGILGGIHLRGLELISADSMVAGALKAVRFIRAAGILLLCYLAGSTLLVLFPWTQPYGRASTDFVLNALLNAARAVFGYIPNLFMIALTVVIVRYINRFIAFLFDAVERGALVIPGFHPELAAPTKQLSRWLVWLLGLVVIFPYLPGSGTPAFQGIGVFVVGLMLSLGSAGTIGNLMSGIVLTYTRSFSLGDRVKIADTTGDVVAHGLISTKIVTIKNEEITIPNAAILGNHIVNYTELAERHGLILHTSVTIGYDAPWRTVHRLLVEAAQATPGVLAEPEPFVLQTSLDDFYVRYEINAYTREPRRMANIYGELHQSIQDHFNAAGVEIMSAHYSSLRDGNEATIPPEHRPAGYEPGAFRVLRVGEEPPRSKP